MNPAFAERYDFPTLPDYLGQGLALLFVGLNPGLYSARQGHYFARSTSRFWPALSRSRLSQLARAGLGREVLAPNDDASLLDFGIGFTDLVKVPGPNAAALRPADFARWAPRLKARLAAFAPRVACFHGVTAYGAFLRFALSETPAQLALGPQPSSLGKTQFFVTPNPSPANAHFRPDDYVHWYDRLADFLDEPSPES